jgi:DNA-binding CsgD family transcriptional regulator/tetratricopeptide (TPR) repeat protein
MGEKVVVAVDDADEADVESAGWLYHLSRRPGPGVPILLLTARPRLRGSALSALDMVRNDPATKALGVLPLSSAAAAELIRSECPQPLPEGLVTAVREICAGYPLLLVKEARALGARSALATVPPRLALAGSVPRDLVHALLARLSRLPQEGTELLRFLEAVAVLGPDAELEACARLMGKDLSTAEPLADCLIEDGLLVAGRKLRYEAAAVALAVLDDMAPSRRSARQLAAARLLGSRGAPAEVVTRHLVLAKGQAGAAREISQAAWLPSRPLAEAALALASSSAEGSCPPSLLATMERAAAALPPSEVAAQVELRVAEAFLDRSRWPFVARAVEGQTAVMGAQSRRGGLGEAVLALEGAMRTTARASVAANALESALATREPGPGKRWRAWLEARAMWALARSGRPARAEEFASLGLSATTGSPGRAAELSLAIAEAFWEQGRVEEARSRIEGAISAMKEEPWLSLPVAQAMLGKVLAAQGRLGEALEIVDYEGAAPVAPSLEAVLLVEQRGSLWLQAGQSGKAIADFLLVGSWEAEGFSLNPGFSTWRLGAAACLFAQGSAEKARALADDHLRLATAFGEPGTVGEALAGLASLCPHGEERLDLLRKAVAHFEVAESPVPLAAALLELGEEHAFYCQSAPEAVKAFRHAADIGYRCGLGPVVERAVGGLHRAGARPRRLALSGPEALTPAELRVASLAAAGCTNAQISSRLYLSNKTVEGHLLRVFRKLGISSRHHLGDHLAPSLR